MSNATKILQKITCTNRKDVFILILYLILISGLMQSKNTFVYAQQVSSVELAKGDKCKVTKGSNKGKTGTYGDDGWCEGDWGGTECGTDKCQKAAIDSPRDIGSIIYDGDLGRVLEKNDLIKNLPAIELRIVGAVRLAKKDSDYIEITDRNCKTWKSIPISHVRSTSVLYTPPLNCDGKDYPILSITLDESKHNSDYSSDEGGPMIVEFKKITPSFKIPGLSSGIGSVGISDADWDDCVDKNLDCQLDTCDGGGGVGGDACLDLCDDVFDACTYDPF